MSTTATPAMVPPEQPSVSQVQRIINTYIAPSKTFLDIRRNASWWAPFILITICSYLLIFSVASKVGFEQVNENQIKLNARAQQRLEQLREQDPAAYQRQMQISTAITKGISYAYPVVALLIFAVIALVLMATFNFGVGAQISFKHAMAIVVYGSLPGLILAILASATLFAGANPESFNFSNSAPTNIAYFLNFSETPRALYSLASWIDVVTIWKFYLMGLGFALVGGVKKSRGLAVLFGWYAVLVLVSVGWAAI
jgi:Yip1 domain